MVIRYQLPVPSSLSSPSAALFGQTSLEQQFLEGVLEFWGEKPELAGTVFRSVGALEAEAKPMGGIVAFVGTPQILEVLQAKNCPLVNTSNRFLAGKLPSVVVDDREVGRIAARHLLERGYRSIHFVSHPDADFSTEREAGLREVCEGADIHVKNHPFPGLTGGMSPTEFIESLFSLGEELLRGDLSQRAVMFFADSAAYSFLAAATSRFGSRLMQLAFMGVDAMEPPDAAIFRITSVRPDFRRVGFEAAAQLARLRDGEAAPEEALRVENAYLVEGDTTPFVEAP